MDWISSFFSNNYDKLTTTAMVCFLLYKTYQYHHLQQKLAQVLEMKSLLLQELSTTKEDLRKLSVIERQESLCDVIFFTGREKGCADHVVDNYDCPLDSCPAYKMRKIVSYIDAAETSLDLCLYLLTNKTLGDSILRARKRGIQIRVISDGDMAYASGSQMVRFGDKKIPIYLTGPPYIMHEKYLLIDSNLVIEGSMNWTTQAVSGNYEHVVITGTPGIVKEFRKHFDTLYERLKVERNENANESERERSRLKRGECWDEE